MTRLPKLVKINFQVTELEKPRTSERAKATAAARGFELIVGAVLKGCWIVEVRAMQQFHPNVNQLFYAAVNHIDGFMRLD